jgi:rfaE bifunctional protein kinase chain/domain
VKYKDIEALFEAFGKKKILIIGDVMIDAYLWGTVDRISPEAPVPVVSCSKREHRLGGAANVALNVQSLGAEPVLCSVIGDDEKGDLMKKLLMEAGMSDRGMMIEPGRDTSVKTRIIGSHQQLLRVDQESTHDIEGQVEVRFAEHVLNIIRADGIDAIIFQDYDKGTITTTIVDAVVSLAKEKNIPTLVDPKKRHFNNFKNVTLFKPNFKELTEGMNLTVLKGDFEGLSDAARLFQNEHNIDNMLITLSELGVFVQDQKTYHRIPAEIRDISDVSGAGDTVVSMASLCLAARLDIYETARLSNVAGGLVCEKVGVVPVTRDMILKDNYVLYQKT